MILRTKSEKSLDKEVRELIKDCQYVADSKNLTYDAELLTMIALKQFESNVSKRKDHKTIKRKADYVCNYLNCLLETIVKFYGKKERYRR